MNNSATTVPSHRPWFLYVLECRDGSLYTGIAVNVEQRFAQHLAGTGARYTRAHPPVRVLATRSYPDRSSASKAEAAMKRKSTAAKWAFVANPDAVLMFILPGAARKKRQARAKARSSVVPRLFAKLSRVPMAAMSAPLRK